MPQTLTSPTASSMTALRAVVYLRVSTDAQASEGTSLDTQRAACLAKAQAIGAQVIGVFADEGISGALYQGRAGIQAALREIEEGRANRLLAFKLDRTGRDVDIIRDVFKRVQAAGGDVVLADGMNFAADATGRLMLTQLSGFAEFEKAQTRERTMRGRRARAGEGVQVSRSMRPYGFILVNKKMVIAGEANGADLGKYFHHPDEAPWVRFIFEQYAAGESLRQVAKKLHNAGVPTARGGKEWEAETISGILSNPVHKGEATFGRETRHTDEARLERGFKAARFNRPAPPEDVIIIPAPAIVSAEMWQAANDRLQQNKVTLAGRRDRRWLLTGLLRCPKCGLSMRVQKKRAHDERDVYSCKHYNKAQTARGFVCDNTRYPVPVVESTVLEALQALASGPESMEAAYDAYLEPFRMGDADLPPFWWTAG